MLRLPPESTFSRRDVRGSNGRVMRGVCEMPSAHAGKCSASSSMSKQCVPTVTRAGFPAGVAVVCRSGWIGFCRSWHTTLLATVLVGSLIAQSGCYRRVVSAKGIGSNRTDIHEPYQEAWPIEPVARELQKNDRNQPHRPKSSGRSGVPVLSGSTDN